MIAKLETGNGFGGALRYDVRAGKGTAKELARVLDAYGVSFDFDEKGDLLINPKQVGFDFRQQTMGYTGEGVIRKPVYHWVLSYSPKDNVSEEQMQKDAKEFLKRIGFDDTQYVMTVHYDKEHHHLHIVTNIVNNQGKRIPTLGLIDKAHEAAAAITKENGYTWGEKMKKENVRDNKMHKPHERAREIIEPMIREALAESKSFERFQEKLEAKGISCKITQAQDGKRGGISYAYEYEGQEHSFRGSSVARDLSFGQVNAKIKKNEKAAGIQRDIFNFLPSIHPNILSIWKNTSYLCYEAVKKEQLSYRNETFNKYKEVYSLYKQYNELAENRNNENDIVKNTEILCAIIALWNPIVAGIVLVLGYISDDIRRKTSLEQKKRLILQIESIRKEIKELEIKKAEIDAQRIYRLKEYLNAKQCYQTYKDSLKVVDKVISETKQEIEDKAILEDIRRKIDRVLPNTLYPYAIDRRQNGSVREIYCTESNGHGACFSVDVDNCIHFEDGSAFNIITGHYIAGLQSEESQKNMETERKGRGR